MSCHFRSVLNSTNNINRINKFYLILAGSGSRPKLWLCIVQSMRLDADVSEGEPAGQRAEQLPSSCKHYSLSTSEMERNPPVTRGRFLSQLSVRHLSVISQTGWTSDMKASLSQFLGN